MPGYATDLYVASQTAHELVVVAPPFNSHSFGWIWIVSLLFVVIGYGVLFSLWKNVPRPIHPVLQLTWFIPTVIASPFLILGVIGKIKTQITLSADTGTLSVRKLFYQFSSAQKNILFQKYAALRSVWRTSACFSM
jgi:hypothetical protein